MIFGQQTRLRDGVLLADEKLDRFQAGHDLVKFFYGGIRQLPEYLVDALLVRGISVTLVKSDDLLVFRHVREHQSFHTGRTRAGRGRATLPAHRTSLEEDRPWRGCCALTLSRERPTS